MFYDNTYISVTQEVVEEVKDRFDRFSNTSTDNKEGISSILTLIGFELDEYRKEDHGYTTSNDVYLRHPEDNGKVYKTNVYSGKVKRDHPLKDFYSKQEGVITPCNVVNSLIGIEDVGTEESYNSACEGLYGTG
jgi:hypothetical protein